MHSRTIMLPDEGTSEAVLALIRTVLIYGFTLLIVRLGSKRIQSRASPFDYVVSIILGSTMSKAMTGSTPFYPTVLAGVFLLVLHWLFAAISVHTDWFGPFVKGRRILLMRDGKIREKAMNEAQLTRKDLEQAAHLETRQRDLANVDRAYLERSGKISIIPKRGAPRVLSIEVEEGVQTVRIELHR